MATRSRKSSSASPETDDDIQILAMPATSQGALVSDSGVDSAISLHFHGMPSHTQCDTASYSALLIAYSDLKDRYNRLRKEGAASGTRGRHSTGGDSGEPKSDPTPEQTDQVVGLNEVSSNFELRQSDMDKVMGVVSRLLRESSTLKEVIRDQAVAIESLQQSAKENQEAELCSRSANLNSDTPHRPRQTPLYSGTPCPDPEDHLGFLKQSARSQSPDKVNLPISVTRTTPPLGNPAWPENVGRRQPSAFADEAFYADSFRPALQPPEVPPGVRNVYQSDAAFDRPRPNVPLERPPVERPIALQSWVTDFDELLCYRSPTWDPGQRQASPPQLSPDMYCASLMIPDSGGAVDLFGGPTRHVGVGAVKDSPSAVLREFRFNDAEPTTLKACHDPVEVANSVSEKLCPVCSSIFPESISLENFQIHVNSHFDNEHFEVVNRAEIP